MFNPYYEITNKQKTKYKILELVVKNVNSIQTANQ